MATRFRYVGQLGDESQETKLTRKSGEEQKSPNMKTLAFYAALTFSGFCFGAYISTCMRPVNDIESTEASSLKRMGGATTEEARASAAAQMATGARFLEPMDKASTIGLWRTHPWHVGVEEAERVAAKPQDWAPSSQGTVFMVRTVNPTEAMLSRMLSWATQLRGTVHQVVFLVDITRSSEITAKLSRAVRDHPWLHLGRDVQIYWSSDRDLREVYPAIDDVQFPPVTKRGHWSSRGPVYWFFVECLSLWYHSLNDAGRAPIRNIWLLEDDVGWSGSNIGDVVRTYENETCDLVTVNANRHPKKPGPSGSWMFTNASTSYFAEWVPRYEDKYSTRLQVQRYSARYLMAAHSLAKAGVIAVSELSSASIVHRLRLTYCDMLGRSSGIPYLSYTRVNRDQWEQLCLKARHEKNPRFYHALKW